MNLKTNTATTTLTTIINSSPIIHHDLPPLLVSPFPSVTPVVLLFVVPVLLGLAVTEGESVGVDGVVVGVIVVVADDDVVGVVVVVICHCA